MALWIDELAGDDNGDDDNNYDAHSDNTVTKACELNPIVHIQLVLPTKVQFLGKSIQSLSKT